MTRSVFVVGSYIPNGGTFISHSLGEVVQDHFGFKFVSVAVTDHGPATSPFDYRHTPHVISLDEMSAQSTPSDLVIFNPSFSDLAIPLRTAAQTLCYVQGFTTFPLLDLFAGHYVSVSPFVSTFLQSTYGIDSPVIPAFVTPPPSLTIPWRDRPEDLVLYSSKSVNALTSHVDSIVLDRLRRAHPDMRFEPLVGPTQMRHADLMSRLSSSRYLLSLSAAEGFGLIPLEAMAAGTAVIGFDGFGGRGYMRDGANCLVAPYPKIDAVINKFNELVTHPRKAESLTRRGLDTARRYDRKAFENRWTRYLKKKFCFEFEGRCQA